MTDDKDKPKPGIIKSGKLSKVYLLVFVVVFCVIGLIIVINSNASKPTGSATSGSNSASGGNHNTKVTATASLSLSPSSQKVTTGSTLTLEVWADSGTAPINAAQANLSYPSDKLTFVSVDDSGSAFGVSAQSTGGNGTVVIVRGSTHPLTGKLLVAKVNFTVTTSSGKVAVDFGAGSAVVSSTNNTNVLSKTYGGSYTL